MLKSLLERLALVRCQRGNVAIEAAFAIPMLVGLAVGAAEYGRAFSTKSELANIAHAGAQAAIEFSGEDESLDTTVRNKLSLAGLLDEIGDGGSLASQLQTQVTSFCTCPGGSPVACDDSCSGSDLPRHYVEVTASVPFSSAVPLPMLSKSMTLSETVSMRLE